jgi:HD-like signal output (HDOD) protein
MVVKQQHSENKSKVVSPLILDGVQSMAPPPLAVTRLMEILSREFHTEEVIEVMQTDPALIASVLKKCNTAFFSQRGGVTSLRQAIQLLGTSMIMSMVLELTVGENLNKGLLNYGISAANLQKHSLCVAVCSNELTKFCGILPFTVDTAFTAGLLHDIGKIVIDDVLTAKGLNILRIQGKV